MAGVLFVVDMVISEQVVYTNNHERVRVDSIGGASLLSVCHVRYDQMIHGINPVDSWNQHYKSKYLLIVYCVWTLRIC